MKTAIMIQDVYFTSPNGRYRGLLMRQEFQDYFPVKLTWRSFTLGASDYDVGDDQMQCPCSEVMERPFSLGEMLRDAQQHIKERHS